MKKTNSLFQFALLFIQPIFMTSNIAIARGAFENIPPVALACSRWLLVFLVFFPFIYKSILKKKNILKKSFGDSHFLEQLVMQDAVPFHIYQGSQRQ
jgi:hypothetical protein